MLTVLGRAQRVCSGPTRRQVLQVGAGLLGISPPVVEAAEALRPVRRARAKSVLFLYLYGGPSQLETFDLKPDAPSGIRGPFRPIVSRTPGLLICEHLPRMAQVSDKFCVVRTMTHTNPSHSAVHWINTGRRRQLPDSVLNASDRDWPSMGSIVEYFQRQAPGGLRRDFPGYVYVPAPLGHLQGYDYPGQYAGWLGRAYNALATNFRRRDDKDNPYFRACSDDELELCLQGLAPQPGITLDRLDRRRRLLEQFDAESRRLEKDSSVQTYDRIQQRAFALARSSKVRQALDLHREPARVRDRYGRHLFGQAVLLGRRMIEAGGRFVTVQWEAPDGYSWDSHVHSRDLQNYLLPGLDQAYSALVSDMADRGLLDETLVVLVSEFGRTPTPATPEWGRGHWCHVFSAVLAGAGVRGGAAYGQSDKHAAYPKDHPTSPGDLVATVFWSLGIDPNLRIPDPQGRPVALVEDGCPLVDVMTSS